MKPITQEESKKALEHLLREVNDNFEERATHEAFWLAMRETQKLFPSWNRTQYILDYITIQRYHNSKKNNY